MASTNQTPKSNSREERNINESPSSGTDEHFSDASEGRKETQPVSPVPVTVVERVDDRPAHGEVPGTEAFEQRLSDASPDEVKIIPENKDQQDIEASRSDEKFNPPGGKPIPKTVVEKVNPSEPAHGEVPGTHAYEIRQADSSPDKVVEAPDIAKSDLSDESRQLKSVESGFEPTGNAQRQDNEPLDDNRMDGNEEAVLEDDFNDFEEETEDDDFGDFNDEFDESKLELSKETVASPNEQIKFIPKLHLPLVDFHRFHSLEDIGSAIKPHLDIIFPTRQLENEEVAVPTTNNTVFQSERSQSLWAQLVAPPSLNPPNWIKSRTRRLFLVSLGVPVDLDEILPASKQRKLILPSLASLGQRSPRPWAEGQRNSDMGDAKKSRISTSNGPSSIKGDEASQGLRDVPEFDIGSISIICSITEAALNNLADDELISHIARLDGLQTIANEALEHWTKKRDQAVGEKEAFEAVIENLVSHARKARK